MHHFPQMPISYGQFVQPQGNGQLLGRHEKTYLPLHATSTVLTQTTTLPSTVIHYCSRNSLFTPLPMIPTEQDLPTQKLI
jgi:hypothetical protein